MNQLNRTPQSVAAVILDLDGTLLDTERMYKACTLETLAHLGWPDSQDAIRAMVGLSSKKCDAFLMATFGPQFPLDVYHSEFERRRADRVRQGIPVKRGAQSLIKALHESDLPFAIATSSSRVGAEHHLTQAGLRDFFETVVTSDDVKDAKPSPDLYLEAAQRLGVEPTECIAVEDSGHGVMAAHAAGMATILVPDMVTPDAQVQALCVLVCEDLNEALVFLETHISSLRESV